MELQVVGRLVGNGLGTLVVSESKDLILDLYNTIFQVQTRAEGDAKNESRHCLGVGRYKEKAAGLDRVKERF
ncbi:hypothetical protein V6N13_055422 [Hibiscus sabdariffa]